MEKLSAQKFQDAAFNAKLHGFKMKAPISSEDWSEEDDQRITDVAHKRYAEMQKRQELLQRST